MKKANADTKLKKYVELSAELKIAKEVLLNALQTANYVVPTTTADRLLRIYDRTKDFEAAAEDRLFRDFPELSDDYLKLFSGYAEMKATECDTAIQKEINKAIREKLKEMADCAEGWHKRGCGVYGYPEGTLDYADRWHWSYYAKDSDGNVKHRIVISDPHCDSDYIIEVFDEDNTVAWRCYDGEN